MIKYIPGTYTKCSDELEVGDVLPAKEGDLEIISVKVDGFTVRLGGRILNGHNADGDDVSGRDFYTYVEADHIWRVNDE